MRDAPLAWQVEMPPMTTFRCAAGRFPATAAQRRSACNHHLPRVGATSELIVSGLRRARFRLHVWAEFIGPLLRGYPPLRVPLAGAAEDAQQCIRIPA